MQIGRGFGLGGDLLYTFGGLESTLIRALGIGCALRDFQFYKTANNNINNYTRHVIKKSRSEKRSDKDAFRKSVKP